MKEEIIQILISRDGISRDEAEEIVAECQAEIDELISVGASLDEVEDTILDFLGLEPDFVMAFL